jgi:hypothetical protein
MTDEPCHYYSEKQARDLADALSRHSFAAPMQCEKCGGWKVLQVA